MSDGGSRIFRDSGLWPEGDSKADENVRRSATYRTPIFYCYSDARWTTAELGMVE